MIHYSCDSCGKPMFQGSLERFEVTIDVKLMNDALLLTDQDPEDDHLQEIDETLDKEQAKDESAGEECYRRLTLDLCKSCMQDYVKNPLPAKVKTQRFKFNDN